MEKASSPTGDGGSLILRKRTINFIMVPRCSAAGCAAAVSLLRLIITDKAGSKPLKVSFGSGSVKSLREANEADEAVLRQRTQDGSSI